MKLTKNSRIEKTLRITEYDIVNKEWLFICNV